MGLEDIRIKFSFRGHRKRRALARILRIPDATGFVIDLWLAVGLDKSVRHDGVLVGWEVDDIEHAAGWNGEGGQLVEALVAAKWLDPLHDEQGRVAGYALHDWEDHQEFVSGYDAMRAEMQELGRRGGVKSGAARRKRQVEADASSEDENRALEALPSLPPIQPTPPAAAAVPGGAGGRGVPVDNPKRARRSR